MGMLEEIIDFSPGIDRECRDGTQYIGSASSKINKIQITNLLPLLRRPLRRTRHLLRNIRFGIRRRRYRLISRLLLNRLIISTLSKLVDSRIIDFVLVALIQVYEEDDVVAQSRQSMQCRHFDGEGKEIVDEGVEELVGHCSGGHVCDTLRWLSVDVGWGEGELCLPSNDS